MTLRPLLGLEPGAPLLIPLRHLVARLRADAQRTHWTMVDDPGDPWMAAMRCGDFARAWRINDEVMSRRVLAEGHCADWPRHLQFVWDGRPLADRRVLVRCYHGLGDTIQFIRFAEPLRAIAREVIVWVQPALLSLGRDGARGRLRRRAARRCS